MITQDDLATLHHLRAAWEGGEARALSGASLAAVPGRAEGRVAHWAFGRAADVLEHAARRRLKIGSGLAPSADEIALLRIARALGSSDWRTAEDAALWLVRRDAVSAFLNALAPAACALYRGDQGKAAPRRLNAATA